MFQYYYRACDLFEGRSVACLAILGDNNPNWRPNSYSEAQWDTSVDFRFRTIKLSEYSDRLEELEISNNPFARFTLAHLKTLETQGNYETRLEWKLRIIQGLYDMGVSEEEIGQLYHDFDWLLTLPDNLASVYHKEMTHFEEKRIMPHLTTAERIGRRDGLRDGRKAGRTEGRTEGRIEGVQESILESLESRLGSVPANIVERINKLADLDRLRRLRKILNVNSPFSEFEEALDHEDLQ